MWRLCSRKFRAEADRSLSIIKQCRAFEGSCSSQWVVVCPHLSSYFFQKKGIFGGLILLHLKSLHVQGRRQRARGARLLDEDPRARM